MKCSNCGKNSANIAYNQNINGEIMNLKLCERCAEKLGIFNNFDDIFSPMIIDLDYILPEEIKCKKCGYTLSKYKSTGLLGCDNCYSTFKNEMDEILLKIQGNNRHIKENKNSNIKSVNKDSKINLDSTELEKLKEELKLLIREEKFEEAVVIRDKIKQIEKKNKEE